MSIKTNSSSWPINFMGEDFYRGGGREGREGRGRGEGGEGGGRERTVIMYSSSIKIKETVSQDLHVQFCYDITVLSRIYKSFPNVI